MPEADARHAGPADPGPPRWLFALVAAGAAARAYLVVWSEGTYDVGIWESHARAVLAHGLTGAYHATPQLNHPPLASSGVALLLSIADGTGLPFRALLRAPIAALDLANVALLAALLRGSEWRWLASGLYAIHPVAILLSAYHGNSDAAIASLLVLAAVFAVREKPALAGAAVGASLAIKLPGLLALPALALYFPRARDRVAFALAAAGAGALTYLPMLAIDPAILWERVFAYRGQLLRTTAGIPIWGPLGLLTQVMGAAGPAAPLVAATARAWYAYDTLILLVPLLALAWLRRGERGAFGLGKTLAACYAVTYGFSTRWAFQYLAWSVPFWLLAGRGWFAAATLLTTAYLYGLYAWLCGDLLLRGPWDFIGHPHWPMALIRVRDAAVLFFMAATCVDLYRAARTALRRAP